MIIYYSGSSGATRQGRTFSEPENVLPDANLMLSYYLIREGQQCQDKRLPGIVKAKQGSTKVRVVVE